MIRARIARAVAFGPFLSIAALVALSALWSTTASAGTVASLKEWGWWTQVNYVNNVNAPQPENPQNMHVQAGPTVCSTDPTCVANQTSATGPTEVSAVRYQLASPLPDSTDPSTPVANLQLTLADQSPPPPPNQAVPVVACRSANPGGWQGGTDNQGGNWTQRAVPNRGGCSNAVAAKDGKTFQFALLRSQMVGADVLDITITSPPNVDNEPPFQLEFKAPTAADLTLYPAGSTTSETFSVPSAPMSASLAAPPAGLPGGAAAVPPPGVTPGRSATPPLTGGALAGALPPAMTGWRMVLLGFLLAVFAAGVLASLVDLPGRLAPAGERAGIGRFTRVRTGPPLPI